MSSLRNAVERRNHKERSQPHSRQKLGILEKHKDYTLRAKDYNSKQAQLKSLRQKALQRNPDEFHFGMISNLTNTNGSKVKTKGSESLSNAAAHLLKTQDAGYLRSMVNKTGSALNQMKQSMATDYILNVGADDRTQNKTMLSRHRKIVFATDEHQKEILSSELRNHESPAAGPSSCQDNPSQTSSSITKTGKRRFRSTEASRIELLEKRKADLGFAYEVVELERARMRMVARGRSQAGKATRLRERKR